MFQGAFNWTNIIEEQDESSEKINKNSVFSQKRRTIVQMKARI